ncbi:MAG: YhjD/YihY/BrkB family envelope integrity protein [Lactovum sp.]
MKDWMKRIFDLKLVQLFIPIFKSSEMSLSSIAVAYYLLLSIFPVLVILINILPYLNINISEVLMFMQENLPEEIYSMTSNYVRSYLSNRNASLLLISIFLALWSFSKSMNILQLAIDKAY